MTPYEFHPCGFAQSFQERHYGICRLNEDEDAETAIKQVLTRKLRMVFLQLPLFTKKADECITDLDKWTYILMNMDKLDDIPWRKEKEAFEAIASIGSYEALSEEDRNRYDDAQRNYWDSIAVYEGAIEKGVEQGEHNKAIKVAKSLIQQDFSDEFIAQTTELTIAEVQNIRNTKLGE